MGTLVIVPRLPKVLDADDVRVVGMLVVYGLLLMVAALWVAVVIGTAFKVFLMAKGG